VDTTTDAPTIGQVLKWDGSNWVPDDDDTGSGSLPTPATKGDLAVWDGDSWEILAAGTDGHAVVADSGEALGLKYASVGGGSGWDDVITAAAAPGGTYDDEFDDASITGWTQLDVGGGAATWTESNGVLSVLNPVSDATAETHAMVKAATINTGDYCQTAIHAYSGNQNFPRAGLIMADGAVYGSGQQVTAFVSISGGSTDMEDYSGYDTRDAVKFSVITEANRSPFPYLHLRLTYVSANTFRLEASPDGVSWVQISTDQSVTLTPTHFGVFSSGWANTSPFVATFHYFRSNA
jgi:hypothetical protein